MLDKSVIYMPVIMHRKSGTPIPEFDLPEGFIFTQYKSGDEKAWAKIETSVLEFDDELDALLYFQREFLKIPSEAERRCIFIENDKGEKIATASAWHAYSGIRRDPILHWVSVRPEYQGLGLGKALISKITQIMLDLDGDMDFYLHTQTWSHKAVGIYQKFGYEMIQDQQICQCKTNSGDYEQAVKILNNLKG